MCKALQRLCGGCSIALVSEPTTYTAHRCYRGKRAIVTLEKDGWPIGTAGGARAARAQAVIVAQWPNSHPEPSIYGLRGDLHAAVVEAERLRTNTTMKTHGAVISITPAAVAIAVPVVDL